MILTVGLGVALAKKYSTYSISWKLRLSFTSTFSEEVTARHSSNSYCLPSVILHPPDTVGSSTLYNSARPAPERVGLTGTGFFATATCAGTGTRCQLHRSQISESARPSGFVIGRSE